MVWQREYVEVRPVPNPPSPVRWLLIFLAAGVLAVLMFLLYAVQPALQMFNVWAFCGLPLIAAVLALAARVYFYGGALDEFALGQERSRRAKEAWRQWGQRYIAVLGNSVLMPDGVSAAAVHAADNYAPRSGTAQRIDQMPADGDDRAMGGPESVLTPLSRVLTALPPGQAINLTVLTDVPDDQQTALRDACQQHLSDLTPSSTLTGVHVTTQLSFAWMEENLKTPGDAVELILVVQAHGKEAYSDGLAALLLCADGVAKAHKLPIAARLLRPMPLDVDSLETDFTTFLQIQAKAREATGVLADRADWQPETITLLAAAAREGAGLSVDHRWILEPVNGVPGPCGHWLLAALGIEMTKLAKEPLLLLASEHSGRWINTVTPGDMA